MNHNNNNSNHNNNNNHYASPSPQQQREEASVTPLSQFQIPSPSSGSPSRLKGSSHNTKSPALYSPQQGDRSEFSSYQFKSNSASSHTTMSPSPNQQGFNQGHDSRYGTSSQYHHGHSPHHDHLQHDVSSPSLSPNA